MTGIMTSNTVDLILTTINERCSATCRIIRPERKPEETQAGRQEENKFNTRRSTERRTNIKLASARAQQLSWVERSGGTLTVSARTRAHTPKPSAAGEESVNPR